MAERVVIVGAGQAGFAAAAKLRQLGFKGSITMFGNEGIMPYQRPPLSKAYLLGKLEADRLSFRNEAFFADQNIKILNDEPVLKIDRVNRQVVTANDCLPYDNLILATGAEPIRLPARMSESVGNIFYLRNRADADRLGAIMKPGVRLLVVGGGYIGLEVAAAARQAGADVTLVEMSPRILSRVAAEPTADYFRTLHASEGVNIHEGVGLRDLKSEGAAIKAVLDNGSSLIIDGVVAGIGVRPNTELAEAAGLKVDGGIVVDEFGCTTDPLIWAAGDCASFIHNGEMVRIESVPHAIDQAEHVARNILGEAKPYHPRPWFWSDQYQTKLQIAGFNRGYDRAEIGASAHEGGLKVSYFKENALIAVDCINDARGFMMAKRELGV
ncbi:NAD(P)/FAD-dependent oxidoreductase [Rhizobium hainanense]|uniref:3-phenylpropionate/trans-cinnamate dioxygenase ferredoxin reductase subunit n=1 Tax=Rhizobium hainanense TaxID=52131 RepID=A0A1C3W8C5_9HYPH|nr:FAD-dependent oxidoreductase [Rhizobium hainanense]SCB36223.1 3-phenylpropionate/trans-cinnamate dioxygenase ferredoxin reductase subunit [Rhizobium hainanense]